MARRCRLLSSDNIEFGLREEHCSDFVEKLVREINDYDTCIAVPFPSSAVLEFLKDPNVVRSPSVTEIRSVLGFMIIEDIRQETVPAQRILSDVITDDSENLNNNLDDSSEYIIKVEVANETIMNTRTQEYVHEDTMVVASSEDHQVNQGRENERTNLHLQNMTRCEEVTTQETDVTISQETPELETPLPLFNPHVMTTGMRVGELARFGDELDTSDLCEINVPQYSFSEIVDEVLSEDADDVGLLETIETFTNTCRSLGASRRLTFTNVDDSVTENKKVYVHCQLKGVPKIKDLKKVRKNKRNGRRGKGL